jgi:putative mRNA 3-end processing factor
MTDVHLDVTGNGAVLLGDIVACDGFDQQYKCRVQTHVHVDHMDGFESSKGTQDIYLSHPTFDLLVTEYNADLGYRENIRPRDLDIPLPLKSCQVKLLSSGHMLGSVQVQVEYGSGIRLGYSGDFQWPLEDVISVDGLVVDSTYGAPNLVREFSRQDADFSLLELTLRLLKRGPVHIKAHRGTLQRALEALAGQINCPIVAGQHLLREAEIYRKYGYHIDPLVARGSVGAPDIKGNERFLSFYGRGDKAPDEPLHGSKIVLSAFMCRPDTPILEYSPKSFAVALSDHADFWGTIEYVRATGAKLVICDNTRGRGVELARELRNRLSVEAIPSSNRLGGNWGE